MITLIIGGSGSGKSEFAENYVVSRGEKTRYYIATMYPYDEECKRKIARHREMRKEKAFTTMECYTRLETIAFPKKGIVLLDCLSNLLANEMYQEDGRKENTAEVIVQSLLFLASQAEELVIVSNDVFTDGGSYDSFTMAYLDTFAAIHRMLGNHADQVIEVVYGIPVYEKGGNNG